MFFILVAVALLCLGISVWALCDIVTKPETAFIGAGVSKTMWVVLIATFIVLFAPIAVVLSIVYLSSVRQKLIRAA